MATVFPRRRKLVIVGDSGVGKTSMLLRFLRDEFPDHVVPTVCEASVGRIEVDGHMVSLVLWDTAGQDAYDRLRPVCYNNTHAFIVCFAVDNRNSFRTVLRKWIPEVLHHCPDVPLVLVGTKLDLRPETCPEVPSTPTGDFVGHGEGITMSRDVNALDYVECSSKTREGIKTVIVSAARAAMQRTEEGRPIRRPCRLL